MLPTSATFTTVHLQHPVTVVKAQDARGSSTQAAFIISTSSTSVFQERMRYTPFKEMRKN